MGLEAPGQGAARSANEALAEQIFASQRARLLAIARRNSFDAEDAEEALQDAFVQFIEHFKAEQGAPPLAWITLTLKRRCWQIYKQRRQRTAPRFGAPAENFPASASPSACPTSPEEAAEAADEIAGWVERLGRLRPDQRRALSLLAIGYSYTEICELTSWTYSKVNRSITEGRAKLRELDLHC